MLTGTSVPPATETAARRIARIIELDDEYVLRMDARAAFIQDELDYRVADKQAHYANTLIAQCSGHEEIAILRAEDSSHYKSPTLRESWDLVATGCIDAVHFRIWQYMDAEHLTWVVADNEAAAVSLV